MLFKDIRCKGSTSFYHHCFFTDFLFNFIRIEHKNFDTFHNFVINSSMFEPMIWATLWYVEISERLVELRAGETGENSDQATRTEYIAC